MRSAFLLSLVCALHGSLCSRATAQGFNARYDTVAVGWEQTGFAIEENSQGELLIVGAGPVVDSLFTSSAVQAILLDQYGTLMHAERNHIVNRATYPGLGNTSAVIPDGRIAIAGGSVDPNAKDRVALYWFSAFGEALTNVEFNFTGDWIGNQLKCTPDGGYIVVGGTYTSNGTLDAFLLKLDSLANVQWVQTYGGPQWTDFVTTVDLAPGGGYYMGGVVGLGSNSYEPWIVRLDSVGDIIWADTTGTPLNDRARAELTTLADGRIVYGCGRPNGIASDHWPQLVKVDSTGSILWNKIYDVPSYLARFVSVKEVTPGGDLIAAGVSYPNNLADGTMLRTTNQGDSIWMRHYVYYDSVMTDGVGLFYDVIPTSDGGFAACGTALGSASGNNPPGLSQDVWVVKVDSLGCIEPGCNVPMGVTTQITNLGKALSMAPNPASERVQLTWQLPAALRSKGAAELSIVSAQGMLVRTVPCDLSRGSLELDVQDLAPGVYHLHMVQQGTWISGGKLVVE